jgi:RHS repeat-associated protein
MGLNSATDGSNTARFEYGPFGEPIRASGPRAADGRIRFSSKYTDQESGLVYYGYRFYNAATGRWINRDPIGERGGLNLYGMVNDNPVNLFDPLGLQLPIEIQPIIEPFPGWIPHLVPKGPYTSPSFYPPAPMMGPDIAGGDPYPSLPKIPAVKNAPECAVRTCPPARMRELNKLVDDACSGANTISCADSDTPSQIENKIRNLRKCIDARILRERECWGGGDKGHVKQINLRNNQLIDCLERRPRLPLIT